MPRYYAKNRYRRRRRRNQYASWSQVGNTVWRGTKRYGPAIAKLASKVALLNVEVKRFDTRTAGTVTLNSAMTTGIGLSAVAQGDTDITRDGNSLKCTGLSMKLHIHPNPTTPAIQTLRLIVVKRKMAGNADIDDILEDVTTDIHSWRNIDKTRVNEVILDKTISYSPTVNNSELNYKFHNKLMHHVKFDNNTATSDQYGGLYAYIMTDEATYPASFTFMSRLRYVDN